MAESISDLESDASSVESCSAELRGTQNANVCEIYFLNTYIFDLSIKNCSLIFKQQNFLILFYCTIWDINVLFINQFLEILSMKNDEVINN